MAKICQSIYDAFPNLNNTKDSLSTTFPNQPKGFACDLCVNLLTEIENILEDQTIDDAVAHAVENLCLPIIWAFEPCYKIVESCLPDLLESFVDSLLPPVSSVSFCSFARKPLETMRF